MFRFIRIAMIALALCASAAQAEQYTCSVNGVTYKTLSPCGATAPRYYGPAQSSSPNYARPVPSAGEAPSYLQYMSPRCASLHDAMRTAGVRGLSADTMRGMRTSYVNECAENENDARARFSADRGEKVRQGRAEVAADQQDRERAALRAQQCGESKRILVTKRARTDLSEGERAELKRFEESYLSRCS